MEYGLPCAGTNVEDGAVSLFDVALAGDLRGGEMAAANDLRIGSFGFFQSCEVLFRNNEHMCRRFRIDIFEGEDVFVLVNFLGRNFAADDATEEAVDRSYQYPPGGNDSIQAATLSAG
jgi:hypothetical protein